MKTNNYWPAIVSTGLITALLWGTALPAAALPGPDDYKKTADDVKKAVATPTPRGALPGPDDYKKTADDVKKATASSQAGALPTAPAPEDVNKAVDAAKGNSPTPSATPRVVHHSGAQSSSTFSVPSNDPKPTSSTTSGAQSSNAPYTFYDRYTDGPQRRDPLPTTWNARYPAGSQKPTSDTEDWHKKNKNKKKHHGDDKTYDGSPILYNKPKRFSVDFDGTKSDANDPNRKSDTEDWHKKNKNEHHHHDGDHDQGRYSVDFDATKADKSSSTDTDDQHKKNQKKHHHHDDGDRHHDND